MDIAVNDKQQGQWWQICQKYLQKYKYLAIMLCAGLLILCVDTDTTAVQTADEPQTTTAQPTQTYAQTFCAELEQTLSCIADIGQVQVMVTLETDGERVYAVDAYTSESSQESTVAIVSDGNYGEQPIERFVTYPSFRGVVVVCEGAGNDVVKLAVMDAVRALCNVDSTQVTILQMGQNP